MIIEQRVQLCKSLFQWHWIVGPLLESLCPNECRKDDPGPSRWLSYDEIARVSSCEIERNLISHPVRERERSREMKRGRVPITLALTPQGWFNVMTGIGNREWRHIPIWKSTNLSYSRPDSESEPCLSVSLPIVRVQSFNPSTPIHRPPLFLIWMLLEGSSFAPKRRSM